LGNIPNAPKDKIEPVKEIIRPASGSEEAKMHGKFVPHVHMD